MYCWAIRPFLLAFLVSVCRFVCVSMEAKMPQVPYQKDPDAIKLFVGQIPKEYGEPQVRELLEQFGPISEITIIKDRVTDAPKGNYRWIEASKG